MVPSLFVAKVRGRRRAGPAPEERIVNITYILDVFSSLDGIGSYRGG
jgi:hypothetical protein